MNLDRPYVQLHSQQISNSIELSGQQKCSIALDCTDVLSDLPPFIAGAHKVVLEWNATMDPFTLGRLKAADLPLPCS